jgi:predicted small metal-binding protein
MDCDFEAHGASDEDVIRQAAAHAERVHGIREITPDLEKRVKAAIRAD